jgi:hypothetical protein
MVQRHVKSAEAHEEVQRHITCHGHQREYYGYDLNYEFNIAMTCG